MARGHLVDSVTIIRKFNLIIITPTHSYRDFSRYKKFHLSKKGMLIGTWGDKPYEYRDYMLMDMPKNAKLLRRTDRYLFFTSN